MDNPKVLPSNIVFLENEMIKNEQRLEKPKHDESDSDTSSDHSAPSFQLAHYSDDDSDLALSLNEPWLSIQDTIISLRQLGLRLHRAGTSHRQERVHRFIQLDRNKQQQDMFEFLALQKAQYAFPTASTVLHLRISQSIATRRARILYLQLHKIKIRPMKKPADNIPEEASTTETRGLIPVKKARSSGSAANPRSISLNSDPSSVQRIELSRTVATKLEMPNKAASVSSVQISTSSFPPMPTVDPKTMSFLCPYCSLDYAATDFESETAWHNHLIHDLEPYFCIDEGCPNPFDCSSSYSEWLSHMKSSHADPRWHCWYCQPSSIQTVQFTSPAELKAHFALEHRDNVTESLRNTVINHSVTYSPSLLSCPFCGGYPDELEVKGLEKQAPETVEALYKHIGSHLLSIALLLLPDNFDPGDVADDRDFGFETVQGDGSHSDFQNLKTVEANIASVTGTQRPTTLPSLLSPHTPDGAESSRSSVSAVESVHPVLLSSDGEAPAISNTAVETAASIALLYEAATPTIADVASPSTAENGARLADSLWDHAYDALKASHCELIEAYEDLVSKSMHQG